MTQRGSVPTSFRIGTVNVHSFRSPFTRKSNAKVLASILGPYNLDLLAVEEVRDNDDWTLLHERLSLNYASIGLSGGVSFGNGIASRYPIIEYSNKVAEYQCTGGQRAMLQCRFGGDHPFLQNRRFAVTHLDHFDEDDRVIQMNEFAPHSNNTNILLCDMNALTQNDYSDKYLHEIVAAKRELSGWEQPRFELTKLLTATWGFQDAFRQMNPESKDTHVATCPYGTRIDYIFHRPLPHDQWILTECFIVNTHRSTDHNAIVATFESKSKSKR
jgi:exonuclease III